jgi:hypothetical protein
MTQTKCEDTRKLKLGSLARGLTNTGFLFGGNAISAVISFVITIYIARILPISDFGSYITVISFVTLFGIFTDWPLVSKVSNLNSSDRNAFCSLKCCVAHNRESCKKT